MSIVAFSPTTWALAKKCLKAYKYHITKTPFSGEYNTRKYLEGAVFDKCLRSLYSQANRHSINGGFLPMVESEFRYWMALNSGKCTFGVGDNPSAIKLNILNMLDSTYQCYLAGRLLLGSDTSYNVKLGSFNNPYTISDKAAVYGVADIVRQNRLSPSIIDIKYSTDTSFLDPDQLLIYAIAAKKGNPLFRTDLIKLGFYVANTQTEIHVPIDEQIVFDLECKIIDKAIEIQTGIIRATPSDYCKYCRHSSLCSDSREVTGKLDTSTSMVPNLNIFKGGFTF